MAAQSFSAGLLAARAKVIEQEREAAEPQHPGETGVRVQLAAIIAELGTEEVMVLTLLARRLLEGQVAYGRLRLTDDERDFEAERGDELADAAVYSAMLELRRMLRVRKGPA